MGEGEEVEDELRCSSHPRRHPSYLEETSFAVGEEGHPCLEVVEVVEATDPDLQLAEVGSLRMVVGVVLAGKDDGIGEEVVDVNDEFGMGEDVMVVEGSV